MEAVTLNDLIVIGPLAVALGGIYFSLKHSINKSNEELKKIGHWISDEAQPMLRDLYTWHDMSDQDGVKVWYVRQSLEKAVDDVAANTRAVSENTKAMASSIAKLAEILDHFQDTEKEILRDFKREGRGT